jgi:hypothetical protein
MRKSLDIESQRGADTQNIFAVELLKNSRFACVIQAAGPRMSWCWTRRSQASQKKDPHFLFFLAVFSDNRQEAHSFGSSEREFQWSDSR